MPMRMTRRFVSLFLSLLIALTVFPAYAEEAEAPAAPAEVFQEQKPEAPAFSAGLARIDYHARIYESSGLWGSYIQAEESGVVFASEMTESGKAVRVTLYDGTSLHTGWVKAASLHMLGEQAAASYDQQPFNETTGRMYRGHVLLIIETTCSAPEVTEAPTATPRPEVTAMPEVTAEPEDTVEPEVTAEPEATDAPEVFDEPSTDTTPVATPVISGEEDSFVEFVPEATTDPEVTVEPEVTTEPDTTTEPEATDAPEIFDEPSADTAPVATPVISGEEDSFVEFVPEATAAPLPEPSLEPAGTDEIGKFVAYKALTAPANLSASHNRLGKMTLKWDGVADAEGYNVLYKPTEDPDAEYAVLATVTGTSYTTTEIDQTILYDFCVQAVQYDANGNTLNASPHSAAYTYIVLGDAKINDPRGKDTSTIRLTWTAVTGATHYDVMMSVHGADEWNIVRTNLVTDYCDISNISFDLAYDFRVIPKRKLENGEFITGNSSRVIMVGSPMETPSFQQYDWTETGLKLTWDAIPGASGYVIYRRAFSDPDVTNYQKLVVLDTPVTTYTDTTMLPGEVYYYFVYSFKLCQPEGWRCFSLKGNIGMGVWLPDVTGVVDEDIQNQGVRLSWPAVTGASHYDVYISTTAGTYPTGNGNGRVSTPYGFHSTAQLGKTYYYRVRPVRLFSNGDVSMGQWSEEIVHTYKEAKPTYRALVLGNTYPNETNQLPGSDNDARAMATMLRRMTGTPYQVNTQLNLSDSGMISAIRSTFADAGSNNVSLFYFSGHGANTPETSFHGSLVGVYHTYLSVSRLKEELDRIPGKKIVIIDSCHSGAMIGKSTGGDVSSAELSAFNSLVVNTFASSPEVYVRSADAVQLPAGEERFTEQPMLIARGENDLANSGYYVITAAHSTEQSVSMGYDSNGDNKAEKYFGLFTYGLCHGSGWNVATDSAISALNADRDGNNAITLYEAYIYAKAMAQRSNPNQTAQIYPANSGLVIWCK